MPKVLIVDDEAEVRQFLSRSLRDCGYAVREASDGCEAMKCVATEHPDVVITDLLMPEMDGFELALRIRADPEHAATKVIFFTGRASPMQVQTMAETAGVAQIVTKPATIDEVQEAVGAALQASQGPTSAQPQSGAAADQPQAQEHIKEPRAAAAGQTPQGLVQDRRFRAFFDRTLDAMLVLDSEGQCLDANSAASELLGYEREALVKLSLWQLTPPEKVRAGREMWKSLIATGRIQEEYQLIHRNGTVREVELSAVADIEPGVHLTMWRDVIRRGPPLTRF